MGFEGVLEFWLGETDHDGLCSEEKQRFGRFPHRNAILDRETTAQEAEFLRELGSSF